MGWTDIVEPWTWPDHLVHGVKGILDYGKTPREKYDPSSPQAWQAQNLDHGNDLYQTSMRGFRDSRFQDAPQADRTHLRAAVTGDPAQLDQSRADWWRTGQQGLVNQLQDTAAGRGLMQADVAAARGNAANLQQQQALMAGARGSDAAAAARRAQMNASGYNVATLGQTQGARIAEQNAARGLLGDVLGQGRGQDLGAATTNAQLQQQMGLANMDAWNTRNNLQGQLDEQTRLENMRSQLTQTGMNNDAAIKYLAQAYGIDEAEMKARLAAQGLYANSLNPGSPGMGGDIIKAVAQVGAAAM